MKKTDFILCIILAACIAGCKKTNDVISTKPVTVNEKSTIVNSLAVSAKYQEIRKNPEQMGYTRISKISDFENNSYFIPTRRKDDLRSLTQVATDSYTQLLSQFDVYVNKKTGRIYGRRKNSNSNNIQINGLKTSFTPVTGYSYFMQENVCICSNSMTPVQAYVVFDDSCNYMGATDGAVDTYYCTEFDLLHAHGFWYNDYPGGPSLHSRLMGTGNVTINQSDPAYNNSAIKGLQEEPEGWVQILYGG